MTNGHTNGQYLDHPSLHPFWERAQALDAVIYLHPTDPAAAMPVPEGSRGGPAGSGAWRPACMRCA
jgi:2,3-dihydroxybenzoate decarboxylase